MLNNRTRHNYYNEIDPFASEWLRNLVAAGHIVPGRVDDRSIKNVTAIDVCEFKQCHFFAGIGAWSHALRLAGWPDDVPVWTGSCPCQPFSAAGKGRGFDDARHLWPEWFRLIRECRPAIVFGEQVASKAGLAWLDVVSADMEGEGYAIGAADLCAACVGAPHIRQRLVFVAYACGERRERVDALLQRWRSQQDRVEAPGSGEAGALADAVPAGWTEGRSIAGGRPTTVGGPTRGFWRDADWLPCTDGKVRSVEPGTFPLAHVAARGVGRGQPGVVRMARRARVGRLRGYGNAIVPEAVAEFIRAAMECIL